MSRGLLGALIGLAALPRGLPAQIRASELASVSQTVDGTKLTIEYSRPRVRGRSALFGSKVVAWDETWTPGANYATTFETSKNVKLEGHPVAKGTYSVWFVVRQSGDWTMVLDPQARRYHMYPPDSSAAQVRFPVRVDSAALTDVLTWWFPTVRADGGTMAFAWERRRVNVRFEVEPSLSPVIAAADARPYLGRYEYQERGKPMALVVTYDDTARTMKGQYDPNDEYYNRFALIRIAPDWFVPGVYDDDGKIYEVYRPERVFQFNRDGARVVSVELRHDDDSLAFRATRKR
jgi:hypothetical protein